MIEGSIGGSATRVQTFEKSESTNKEAVSSPCEKDAVWNARRMQSARSLKAAAAVDPRNARRLVPAGLWPTSRQQPSAEPKTFGNRKRYQAYSPVGIRSFTAEG